MGTTLGLPRTSSIFGLRERTGKVSSLLGISRETAPKYHGESAGVDPDAQERFLDARALRRQKALDALMANPDLDSDVRNRAMSLVPRLGTLAIVSAPNFMHDKRKVSRWAENALEGLDRTGIHRGIPSVALQTVLHTDKVYDRSFARYAGVLAETGNKNGFVIENSIENIILPIDHEKSGQLDYLPEWLASSLGAIDSPPHQENPFDQGVVILTDEISFTHAVSANTRAGEYGKVFDLEVAHGVGVLSLHDMHGNGAAWLSRGSYPY